MLIHKLKIAFLAPLILSFCLYAYGREGISAARASTQGSLRVQASSPEASQQQHLMEAIQLSEAATAQVKHNNGDNSNLPDTLSPQSNEAEGNSPEASLQEDELVVNTSRHLELRLFGSNVFNSKVSTFAPAENIPVPVNYILGPGDVIRFQMIGHENLEGSLLVDRNGEIQVPGLGKLSVIGLTFESFEEKIKQIVTDHFIGTRIEVTMGPLRSIRVFVLGDVNQPGSYTVSSLATITNALFVSGGIDKIGTYRNIQLKRQGEVVAHLDLYDLLIHGDSSKDVRLQPGDVIFVPPAAGTVAIDGAVKRPAIYEIKDERELAQIIELAGGATQYAFLTSSSLERINPEGERTFYSIDLSDSINLSKAILPGDQIHVGSALNLEDNIIELRGHLKRPGRHEWTDGLRIQDIITSENDFLPNADLNYILIYRKSPKSVNYETLLSEGADSSANIALQKGDIIYVFERGKADARQRTISGLISQLKHLQSSGDPVPVVSVEGYVNIAGRYPLEAEMRIADLVRAAGGLNDAAYTSTAELTRYVPGEDQLKIVHININLSSALLKDLDALDNIELLPYDRLLVRPYPEWNDRPTVTLHGEVRFPGVYALKRGETIAEVIERAGGFTDQAFLNGAILTRVGLKQLEKSFLEKITARLEADLASASIEQSYDNKNKGIAASDTAGLIKSLISKMQSTEAVGRLAFNLPSEMQKGPQSFPMKDGDTLYIPQKPISVSVFGEVYFPTSHIYNPRYKLLDYIMSSGGFSDKADKRHVYVVRANGQVVTSRQAMNGLEAGDTIVVPLKVDRIPQLTFWSSISQIFYNIAISAVAIARI